MKDLKIKFINYLYKELKKVKIKSKSMRDEIAGEDIDGYYDSKSNTIWFNEKYKDEKNIREIVLHEIFEWIFWKLFKSTKQYWDIKDEDIKLDDTHYVIAHSDIDKNVRKIK